MDFTLDITLSDKNYLDYNIFWMIKSPYGKKQMMKFRSIISAFFVLLCFFSLLGGGFSKEFFIGMIPLVIVFVLIQAFFNSFLVWTLKGQMKSLKKKGKMAYSPTAQMKFYEDDFIEITPTNKIEQTYSAIERISVIRDQVLYIHVNNITAYILPRTCFDSQEQYDEFFAFIKTKCANIDVYK